MSQLAIHLAETGFYLLSLMSQEKERMEGKEGGKKEGWKEKGEEIKSKRKQASFLKHFLP